MTETYPTTSNIENVDSNAQLLERSIQGAPLVATYQAALRMDPRLEEVDLVIQTEDMQYPAHASPSWGNESGRHEVHLRFDDTNSTEPMNDKMDGVPGARQLFADIVGVPPDSMTPEASNAFMLLHELGHTRKFFDHQDNPAELDQQQKREWMALPLGNVATSVLMNPDSKEHSIIRSSIEDGIAPLGISSMKEAYEVQHNAYRQMYEEKAADDFARAVFAANPDLAQNLI